MDLDDLKNMSSDPDLIPGIYNYCDRWCERCYLSSRCLTFKMEQHESRRSISKDLSNKEFWDDLSDTFALTMELLYEMAEEHEVDLDKLDDEEVYVRPVDDAEIAEHPVNKNAEAYFQSASQWLEDNREVFIEKSKEYKSLVKKNISPERNADKVLVLHDLFEIISWYHSMILVKAKRAIMGLLDDEYEDEIQNDMNGTAKVVLLCIERSMFAWNGLLKYMPEQEEAALKNLALLQKLENSLRTYFPNAEKFIRPGFDE